MSREKSEALGAAQFMLLLHSVPYVGEKTLTRLLRVMAQERLTPDACLALPEEEWVRLFEMDARVAASICDGRAALLAKSAALARTLRAYPLRLLTLESATYPARLERNDDAPPPILYALGSPALLDPPTSDRFTFTAAVSNGAPPASLARMDAIATDLVRLGGIPVTGHDRPAYKRLALAAQRLDRSILYVFDRGMREALGPAFDRPPFAAARIRDAVFETARDLALSPFRLDDHSIGANNLRRDRLIFALSDVVIALDVRAGGAMAAECLRAHQQGRPVYVVEGGRSGGDRLGEAGCPPLPADPAEIRASIAAGLEAGRETHGEPRPEWK